MIERIAFASAQKTGEDEGDAQPKECPAMIVIGEITNRTKRHSEQLGSDKAWDTLDGTRICNPWDQQRHMGAAGCRAEYEVPYHMCW